MKKDYTHIVLLIDRSGSMYSIKEDMEGGIASFLDEQKQQPGECTVTAASFNDKFDLLFTNKPVSEVEPIKINPNGGTALLDSMVRLINTVGSDLAGLDEEERPERVLFVTITDGEENSSHEFSTDDLKTIIKEQEDTYNWNFTYIGANQDMFTNAVRYGGKMSSSLNYEASSSGVKKMFSKLSDATTRYRSIDVQDLNADAFEYTAEEQKDI